MASSTNFSEQTSSGGARGNRTWWFWLLGSLLAMGTAGFVLKRISATKPAHGVQATPAAKISPIRAGVAPIRAGVDKLSTPLAHPDYLAKIPRPNVTRDALQEPVPEQPQVSQEAARAQHIQRIAATGPDQRGLVADAEAVGQQWQQVADDAHLDVKFERWECYHAGCLASASHASTDVVDSATEAITQSASFASWNGEKLRTGPVQTGNDRTEVTWILLSPPEGEPTRNATATPTTE